MKMETGITVGLHCVKNDFGYCGHEYRVGRRKEISGRIASATYDNNKISLICWSVWLMK